MSLDKPKHSHGGDSGYICNRCNKKISLLEMINNFHWGLHIGVKSPRFIWFFEYLCKDCAKNIPVFRVSLK